MGCAIVMRFCNPEAIRLYASALPGCSHPSPYATQITLGVSWVRTLVFAIAVTGGVDGMVFTGGGEGKKHALMTSITLSAQGAPA